jgi:hypothetical protein
MIVTVLEIEPHDVTHNEEGHPTLGKKTMTPREQRAPWCDSLRNQHPHAIRWSYVARSLWAPLNGFGDFS